MSGRQLTGNRSESAKLRVENIHYDLTEEELEDLFNRIGPVEKLSLQYDRSGRSEGTAYVTYEQAAHARAAIREFDGANAKGQPIHLALMPVPRAAATAVARRNLVSSRPLAERITERRATSDSPVRHSDVSKPPPEGVDRYVPSASSGSSGRRDGRRPGARRELGAGGAKREALAKDGRPRKTQEELDAEMVDYFGGNGGGGDGGGGGGGGGGAVGYGDVVEAEEAVFQQNGTGQGPDACEDIEMVL